MGGILCDVEDTKIFCPLILAVWHFVVLFQTFLASVVLAMTLYQL